MRGPEATVSAPLPPTAQQSSSVTQVTPLRLAPAAAFALTTCQVEVGLPVGVGLGVATAVGLAREVPSEAVEVVVAPQPAVRMTTTMTEACRSATFTAAIVRAQVGSCGGVLVAPTHHQAALRPSRSRKRAAEGGSALEVRDHPSSGADAELGGNERRRHQPGGGSERLSSRMKSSARATASQRRLKKSWQIIRPSATLVTVTAHWLSALATSTS